MEPEVSISPAPPESRPTGSAAAGKRQARNANSLGLWLRDIAIAAVASILIITFLYQPVRVEGTSMAPWLEDSDRLFINKYVYRFTPVKRGDVVVFRYPRDPEKSYIKRVIAQPGDRLSIERGKVWLNGKPLNEPYVTQEYRDQRSLPELVVPAGSYFMMGDHRSISSDSRDFGPVDRALVSGKAIFVYWPSRDMGSVR